MSAVFQVVPYPAGDPLANDHFQEDFSTLCHHLKGCCDGKLLEVFAPEIHNPYPIGITLQAFGAMKDISKVLHRAIQKIVGHYFDDKRLHGELLMLAPRAVEVLRSVRHLPYNIGSWRPDVLFPHEDCTGFKICEINARFPFNAFFASHEKNTVFDNLPYLRDAPIMAIKELEEIPKVFKAVYDPRKSVGILKEKEGGWDVKLFQASYSNPVLTADSSVISTLSVQTSPASSPHPTKNLMRSNSFPRPDSSPRQFSDTFPSVEARFVHPLDLRMNDADGLLYDSVGPLEQFALECDQDFLLSLPPDVLSAIVERSVYINDIRTILVAHDKRLLAVLSDENIMKDYLCPEDVSLLQRHIIKTYVVGSCTPEILASAKTTKNDWLIKPNGSGKGEGIVFGTDCETDAEWIAILEDVDRAHFILQPWIKQQTFNITTAQGTTEMLVVGLLHNFNDSFFGPGIFRASRLSSPIVNVSGGNGIILSPCVVSSRFALVRTTLESCRDAATSTNATTGYIPDALHGSLSGGNGASHNAGLKHLLASESTSLHFQFPAQCTFRISSSATNAATDAVTTGGPELIQADNYDNVMAALMTEGIVKIESHGWENDEVNDKLIELVSHLGILNQHSSTESDVWDVRPNILANDVPSLSYEGNPRPPRSHTSEEFPMHTDCSFEEIPPRYVLLFVCEEDHYHGGLTTLVDSTSLFRYLSKKTLAALHKYEFEMRVPAEFFKGVHTIKGRILSAGKLWRYRSDTIVRESCNSDQLAALDELDKLLDSPHIVLTTTLKKGNIFLLDNSRWFHGRTAIHDKSRWLKRIRFHPKGFNATNVLSPFAAVLMRSESLGISGLSPRPALDSLGSAVDDVSPILPAVPARNGLGVFGRLYIATQLLLAVSADQSLISNYEFYLRAQLQHIEALQYYMIDFKSVPLSLFRYSPVRHTPIVIMGENSPLEWILVQAANVVISGNVAHIVVSDRDFDGVTLLCQPCSDYITVVSASVYAATYVDLSSLSLSVDTMRFHYNGKLMWQDSSVVLTSVMPSLRDLCTLDIEGLSYLQKKYNLPRLTELMDEFDLIEPLEREAFVTERSRYLVAEVTRQSPFYQSLSTSSTHRPTELQQLPIISGDILSSCIQDILAQNKKYNISFASGGTTGTMKFVYRTQWEDQENARYIAKGLLASGVTPGDIVCNTLSSGFWGGMHVFNLALQYIGCSLVPLGSAVPFDQVAGFMRTLKPTALLTMPTWLLSFSEYLERNGISDMKVSKVITGGEMLFKEARMKIQSVLGLPSDGFMSTGYTSNETGVVAFRCALAEEGYFHVHENMQHVSITETGSIDDGSSNDAKENVGINEDLGMIVTSNLNRTLMPVLRYRIGDVGKIIAGDSKRRCACGRTLQTLFLQGRADNKIRVSSRDLYLDEVAKTISMVPALALHFSVHILKSPVTLRDALEFHVERQHVSTSASADQSTIDEEFLRCLTVCSPDFCPKLWDGPQPGMDKPVLILYEPGTLPRNARTGKISLVIDKRKVS